MLKADVMPGKACLARCHVLLDGSWYPSESGDGVLLRLRVLDLVGCIQDLDAYKLPGFVIVQDHAGLVSIAFLYRGIAEPV